MNLDRLALEGMLYEVRWLALKRILVKLHCLALEETLGEAALASLRRNQANVGFRARGWAPGWLGLNEKGWGESECILQK